MEEQATIGIIGGGQLGRMLALAAAPLGFKVIVVNPTAGGSASQVGAQEIIGDLYDPAALKNLVSLAKYITIEIEHLNASALEILEKAGAHINPNPRTICMIQDKYLQKKFLHDAGIPVAPFQAVGDEAAANKALKTYNGKMLLKTRHGAYDGRGNMVINNTADIKKAFELFAGKELYAEAFIPFEKELAVMVARSKSGQTAQYPIVETIHKRNICVEVIAPAPIKDNTRDTASKVAGKVAGMLEGAGVFGIEMFLAKTGEILVNEIAPRVHNSGHYTMDASRTSQFEQHIRAITGLPLGDTSMVVPAAVMINILGERDGQTEVIGLDKVLAIPHVSVHLYGKSPTKVDRKMGHINATGNTIKQAQSRARKARKQLSI